MMHVKILWLIPCFLLAACTQNSVDHRPQVQITDSLGITIVDNDVLSLSDACQINEIPRVSIGESDGNESYLLHRVFGALKLSSGRIAIANRGSNELRIFDSRGSFLYAAGGKGAGPGEFQNIFSLWSTLGDTIWVGDYRPWEYEVFDSDGQFVRQVRPRPQYTNPPERMGLLDDGKAILAVSTNQPRKFEPVYLAFLLHDSDGALVDTLTVVENGHWGQIEDDPTSPLLYPLFESFAQFASRGQQITIGQGRKAELMVFQLRPEFYLEKIIRWNTTDRNIQRSEIDIEYDKIRDRYATLDEALRTQLVAPLVHPSRPIADIKPSFDDLVIGADGSYWVKQFQSLKYPEKANWLRFDKSGQFSCHLVIDSELEVYEFGSKYILGKLEDEVERVLEYNLTLPQGSL